MHPPDLFPPRRIATEATGGKRYSRSSRLPARQARIENKSMIKLTSITAAATPSFDIGESGFGGLDCVSTNWSGVTDGVERGWSFV